MKCLPFTDYLGEKKKVSTCMRNTVHADDKKMAAGESVYVFEAVTDTKVCLVHFIAGRH